MKTNYGQSSSLSQLVLWVGIILLLVLAAGNARAAAPKFNTKQITSGIGKGATWLVYGDFNKDGRIDMAAGNHKNSTALLAWYPGPNFTTKHDLNASFVTSKMMGNTSASDVGDINKDGWLDIVVPTSNYGNGAVYWMENPKGKATGTWKYHLVHNAPSSTYHFADVMTGDMDKDGKLDIVVRDLGSISSGDPKFKICFQDGPDKWTIKVIKSYPREGATVHDVDKDGNLDIVGNGFWYKNPGGANARTKTWSFHNIHTFHYKQKMGTKSPDRHNNSSKVAFGDLDGDKIDDVVLSTAEGKVGYIAWYKGPKNPAQVSANWAERKLQTGLGAGKTDWQLGHTLRLGDIDGDGDLDIMSGIYKVYGSLPKIVNIWYNNGNAKSWTRVKISDKGIYQGILFDAEDDGDLDIMGPWTNNRTSPIYYYQNTLNPPGGGPKDTVKDTTVTDTTRDTIPTPHIVMAKHPFAADGVGLRQAGGVIRFSFAQTGTYWTEILNAKGQRIHFGHNTSSNNHIVSLHRHGAGPYIAVIHTQTRRMIKRFVVLE